MRKVKHSSAIDAFGFSNMNDTPITHHSSNGKKSPLKPTTIHQNTQPKPMISPTYLFKFFRLCPTETPNFLVRPAVYHIDFPCTPLSDSINLHVLKNGHNCAQAPIISRGKRNRVVFYAASSVPLARSFAPR